MLCAQDAASLVAGLLQRPDLILLAAHLPGLDATDASRRLRASADTGHIPVIALCAGEGDRWPARSAANESLAKPFYRKDLLAAVRRWMPHQSG